MIYNPTLLSFEQAMAICEHAKDSRHFYYTTHDLGDGYIAYMFNYHLAQQSSFTNPLPGSDINALEMRGLTFILKDGVVLSRHLLLHKFFNLNQNDLSNIKNFDNLSVLYVNNKEDGSIISFIRLPNGNVVAKTKMSFISEQSIEAMKIYNENQSVNKFTNYCLDKDIVPMFEYVGFDNIIVLNYPVRKLILIRLRDNNTGEYIDMRSVEQMLSEIDVELDIAPFYNISLPEILEKAETNINTEGWVITFENFDMLKVKTEWYFNIHNLVTEKIHRENDIIEMILNDTIDDILARIDTNMVEQRQFVLDIIDTVTKYQVYIGSVLTDYIKQVSAYETIGEMATTHKNDEFFHYAIGHIKKGIPIDKLVDSLILDKSNKLNKAREFVAHMRTIV